LTWALILASARHIVRETSAVRSGGWHTAVGAELRGKVLGILGLGNIGREVARIDHAFGVRIIAWSENMTPELPPRQARHGSRRTSCFARRTSSRSTWS
jgi:phosphoglycerate dehydrogenase-like enzyme